MTRATVRAALTAFLVSRGLIFFLIVFVSQMAFEGKDANLPLMSHLFPPL